MRQISLTPGAMVQYTQKVYRIRSILDMGTVLGVEQTTNQLEVLPITQLIPLLELPHKRDFELASELQQEIAKERYRIIEPILNNRGDGKLIRHIAKIERISRATLYRWVERFELNGTLSALIDWPRDGGKGISRLEPPVDTIISDAIEKEYLNKQRKRVQSVATLIQSRCRTADLPPPNTSTVRRRIRQLSQYLVHKHRYGTTEANNRLGPIEGSFPGATHPLAVGQIDHALGDVILVDEVNRKEVGRPWITVVMDVYSRMILGFHVSFDPPGASGTGLCIGNAILPKEDWLIKQEPKGTWPCWGIMQTLHCDNAREFRGKMLRRACEEYRIKLQFRPVKKPNYGGHIERLMGTLLREIQTIPGNTFSTLKEREGYDSQKNAIMTLPAFERWLTIHIVDEYHQRLHQGLGQSPLQAWQSYWLQQQKAGKGLPPRLLDTDQVKRDWMPFMERTIQRHGIEIDMIIYYHEVLRRWIKAPDETHPTLKRRFLIRRDPRDISVVYFYDPELHKYFPIPYRNTANPPISIWEWREARKLAKLTQRSQLNEDHIFEAYEKKQRLVEAEGKMTKQVQRQRRLAKRLANKETTIDPTNTSTLLPLQDVKPFGSW